MQPADRDLLFLNVLLERQKRAQERDGTPDLALRIERLSRALALLDENAAALVDAILADCGGGSAAAVMANELALARAVLADASSQLPDWIKCGSLQTPHIFRYRAGSKSTRYFQPRGVLGIQASWQAPLRTSLGALACSLAAGNRCLVLAPSEVPFTATLLAKLSNQYFDRDEVAILGAESEATGESFSRLSFDQYYDAGLPEVSGSLTGKSWRGSNTMLIGREAKLAESALFMARVKSFRAGQDLRAIEHAYIRESDLNEWIAELERAMQHCYPAMIDNPDYFPVITSAHAERLRAIIDDARDKQAEIWEINLPRENFRNPRAKLKMPLTLVINPAPDLRVATERLCGPLLAVWSYRHIDDAIESMEVVNDRETLYYFGDTDREREAVLARTHSRHLVVNPQAHRASGKQAFFAYEAGCLHGRAGFEACSRLRQIEICR